MSAHAVSERIKKLRVLAVSFDTHIEPYQLPAFRGALAHKVGIEHDWFHNHDNINGGFHNRYPLIQYKLDTYKGQFRPMMLCLDAAVEEAHHFFSQPDWTVRIGDTHHALRIAKLNVNQYTLNVWEQTFAFRIHKWQALNDDNFEKYQSLTGIVEKLSFLEKLLTTQITSFAKGVDWEPERDITVKIKSLPREEWMSYKHHQKMRVFSLDFDTNVSLPDFIGLGKGASRGLGVVRRFGNKV